MQVFGIFTFKTAAREKLQRLKDVLRWKTTWQDLMLSKAEENPYLPKNCSVKENSLFLYPTQQHPLVVQACLCDILVPLHFHTGTVDRFLLPLPHFWWEQAPPLHFCALSPYIPLHCPHLPRPPSPGRLGGPGFLRAGWFPVFLPDISFSSFHGDLTCPSKLLGGGRRKNSPLTQRRQGGGFWTHPALLCTAAMCAFGFLLFLPPHLSPSHRGGSLGRRRREEKRGTALQN